MWYFQRVQAASSNRETGIVAENPDVFTPLDSTVPKQKPYVAMVAMVAMAPMVAMNP